MPGPISQFKRGQIIALRDSGMGPTDISAHLNISGDDRKHNRSKTFQTLEHTQLTELLVVKDNALKAMLKRAAKQAKMEALKAEVERQDQDRIQQLQRQLKEAE